MSDTIIETDAAYQPLKIGIELAYDRRSGDRFTTGCNYCPPSFSLPGQPDVHVARMEDLTDAAWFQAQRPESKDSAIWRVSDLERDRKGRLSKVHVEVLTDEDASAIRREPSTTGFIELVKANWWPIPVAIAALYFYLR